MRVPLLAALLTVTALAGCLGADDLPADAPALEEGDAGPAIVPAQAVDPIQGDPLPALAPHDHANPAQHDVAVNMELLAHPPITDDDEPNYWLGGVPLGLDIRFGELDAKGDWLAQCAREADGAYLWNISDGANPVLTARIADVGGCADLKLTDDANYLVVNGGRLYDLRDKENPVAVVENRDTYGCHMCSLITIDGAEYVVASGNGAGFGVAKITREPPSIEPVSAWGKEEADALGTLAEPDIASTVHDQYAYWDPLLGKPLVVTAMWDYGLYVVDLTDPAAPADLGHWGAYRGESGNLHAVAVDIRNVSGELRRIIVGATETGWIIGGLSAVEPGYVYVFDATDLDHIELLGKWANPGRRPTGVDPRFFPVGEYSAHNLQFTQGRAYVAHYHAGVWVLDIDAFLATNPGPKGDVRAPLPDNIPNLGVILTRDPERQTPGQVWDVVVRDGYVYASDYALGLFVFRFVGDPLNDPAYTSTA